MENTQPTPAERGIDFFLIKFFEVNPGEELSTEDIAVKWDVPQSAIHSRLSVARAKRLVDRRRDEDGTWYYMAGAALTAGPAAAAQPQQPLPSIASPAPGALDLDAIEPQSGIPLPSTRQHGTSMHSFQKLLHRMLPGQCTPPLPNALRYTARKALTAQHTQNTAARYTMRAVDTDHIRVWRIQ